MLTLNSGKAAAAHPNGTGEKKKIEFDLCGSHTTPSLTFKISIFDRCAPFYLSFYFAKIPLSVRRKLFYRSRRTLPFLGSLLRFLSNAFLPQCWLSYSL